MEAKTYHVFTFDSSPDRRGFMDDRSGSSLPAEDVLSSRSAYCSGSGCSLDVSRAVVAPAISSNGFYLGELSAATQSENNPSSRRNALADQRYGGFRR